MPYIKQCDREKFNDALIEVQLNPPKTCGELNYLFTMICREYLKLKGESYQTYNDITGALENCKLEFVRRNISPYEDLKIKENGDVQ